MKTNRSIPRLAVLLLSAGFISLAMPAAGFAQLNEEKIERDASGIYRGSGSGGIFAVTYDNPLIPGFSFAAEPGEGSVKVPVKDGKLKTTMADEELPGNGVAAFAGKEKKSKVLRGGKKIVVKAVGTMAADEGPTHGPWVGGVISGALTAKGAKWNADTITGAYQRNGVPPDHTKTLSGRILKGKH